MHRIIFYLVIMASNLNTWAGYPNCENSFVSQDSQQLLIIFEGRMAYYQPALKTYLKLKSENGRLCDAQAYYEDSIFSPKTIDHSAPIVQKVQKIQRKSHKWKYPPKLFNSLMFGYPDALAQSDLIYLPYRRPDKAFSCILKILKKKEYSQIKLIGYSQGGSTAIKISNKLSDKNYLVKSLLTIDPVFKGIKSYPSLFGGTTNSELETSSTHWTNFYQRNDVEGFIMGLRGVSFKNADSNNLIESNRGGHGNLFKGIYKNPVFKKQVIEFLEY